MENAKKKAMEPKEWLDRMINELDRLHMLYRFKPDDTYPCACYTTDRGTPALQVLDSSLITFCNAVSGTIRYDIHPGENGIFIVKPYFRYREHKIYSYTEMTMEEVQKLCN